jgi:alkylation response protein AidB-like acyl-CoA dehydrogenase
MNFDLTDEQKKIREMAGEFAIRVIAPRAEELERTGEYPYDIMAQMASLGIMGIPFPKEYGGGVEIGSACISALKRTQGRFVELYGKNGLSRNCL